MTDQLTIKQSIKAEFEAYMKEMEIAKLSARVGSLEVFKTAWSYGQDELDVRPYVDSGKVMVTISMGYWGSASGYHPYGSETYTLEGAFGLLATMKEGLGETVYQPKYSGCHMGQVLDHIKSSLLSI